MASGVWGGDQFLMGVFCCLRCCSYVLLLLFLLLLLLVSIRVEEGADTWGADPSLGGLVPSRPPPIL